MTTITLPLAIWGTGYARFLPRWWEGVKSLKRQPDEVVIVTDAANYEAALKSVPEGYSALVEIIDGKGYSDFWNKAVELCTSDWISICNADDLFLPEALNEIDSAELAGCNLITDSIQDLVGGAIHKSKWNGRKIGTEWTMVGAEPMKRDLFLRAGGFEPGQRFADWALAIKCYLVGVSAYDTNTVRILYDRGLNRRTLSSKLNPPEVLIESYRDIARLSKELGFIEE